MCKPLSQIPATPYSRYDETLSRFQHQHCCHTTTTTTTTPSKLSNCLTSTTPKMAPNPRAPPGFTNNPEANPPAPPLPLPSSPFPSASTPRSSPPSSADPPPPLPDDLDAPTPAEEAALDAWLRRHPGYITTIRWHRYAALPALAPLWGYADCDFRAECLESLLFYTRAAGRKLSDDERDAVMAPIARTAVAASYDRPVALGLAGWGMGRSWAKSGLRETLRRSAAAAATPAAGMGQVGVDGHITHFAPPQQPRVSFGSAGGVGRPALVRTFLKRVARTSTVGLSCAVGYYALWTPYRFLLGNHEVDSIREELRLEKMCSDMDANMRDKMADIIRKHGGGF